MSKRERRNYYRILGVQPDASIDVIRSAYRTLMQKLRCHPDLGGDERDAAIINEAWSALRNPARRQAYDLQLLSDHDIRMLASAGKPLNRPVPGAARTRRNHYRILGVQADAPQALIESAYKAMCRDDGSDQTLIADAYAVLGDPASRRRYDSSPDSIEPVVPEPATPQSQAESPDAYNPVIHTFCMFCKTPHSPYPGKAPSTRCFECQSPLQRLRWDVNRVKRSFRRLDLGVAVAFYEYWPCAASRGRLNDVTPEGLRLTAQKRLEPGQVVRVSATVFDAVARVVHCVADTAGFSSGMELLTVDFATHGVFVDVES